MVDQSNSSKVFPDETIDNENTCQLTLDEQPTVARKVRWSDLLYKYATRRDRVKFWCGLLCIQ